MLLRSSTAMRGAPSAVPNRPWIACPDILGAGARLRLIVSKLVPAAAVERARQPLDPPDIVGIIGDDDRVRVGQRLDAAELRDERPEDARRGFGRDIAQPDQPGRHLPAGIPAAASRTALACGTMRQTRPVCVAAKPWTRSTDWNRSHTPCVDKRLGRRDS
jgi:hypothetical protein